MTLVEPNLGELLAQLIKECVRAGQTVELDGLGRFQRDDSDGLLFIAETAPRVFIGYASEDYPQAIRLADDLNQAGFKTWVDKRKLLPGQHWRGAIERAIERSDFFVACFSSSSARKRGFFQQELRIALRCVERMPLDDTFIIPVRLDKCTIPSRIQSRIQHVDLFPDWEQGVRQLSTALWEEFAARLERE